MKYSVRFYRNPNPYRIYSIEFQIYNIAFRNKNSIYVIGPGVPYRFANGKSNGNIPQTESIFDINDIEFKFHNEQKEFYKLLDIYSIIT